MMKRKRPGILYFVLFQDTGQGKHVVGLTYPYTHTGQGTAAGGGGGSEGWQWTWYMTVPTTTNTTTATAATGGGGRVRWGWGAPPPMCWRRHPGSSTRDRLSQTWQQTGRSKKSAQNQKICPVYQDLYTRRIYTVYVHILSTI